MFLNEDGTLADDWIDDLPDELKEYAKKLDILDFPDLVKKTMNAEKALGKNSNKLTIPDKDSSEEVWDAWHKAHGKPDTANDYKVEIPEELAAHYPEDEMKVMMEWAFENNVPAELFEKFLQRDIGITTEMLAEQKKAADAQALDDEHALRKEFGQAYDDHMHNIKKLLHQQLPQETERMAMLDEIGNKPAFARFLSGLAGLTIEAGVLKGDLPTLPTPKETDARLAEINATPGFIMPFTEGDHKGMYLKDVNMAEHTRLMEESETLVNQSLPKAG